MAINRRNVLLGLGAIVGGGGALVGTGAFSSVSAAREVSVSTTGDASAYLDIEGDGDYIDNTNTGQAMTIDLGNGTSSGFNKEAVTSIDKLLTISSNDPEATSSTSLNIGVAAVSDGTAPSSGSEEAVLELSDGSVVTFTVDPFNASSAEITDESAGEAYIDVTVDTRSSPDASGAVTTDQLYIVATQA